MADYSELLKLIGNYCIFIGTAACVSITPEGVSVVLNVGTPSVSDFMLCVGLMIYLGRGIVVWWKGIDACQTILLGQGDSKAS